jgi:hypothetical protein
MLFASRAPLTRREALRFGAAAAGALVATRSLHSQTVPPLQVDDDGLIVHANRDGGDTGQREGWYWFGVWIREHELKDPWAAKRALTVTQVMDLLEPAKDGVFYRHPKLKPWNNPYDKDFGFSRDQMVPLVASMWMFAMNDRLRRLWNKLPQDPVGGTKHTFNGEWKKFLGFNVSYSGDIVGPMTINLFRRAWGEDPMLASDKNGPGGETELARNVDLRIAASVTNRDNTGDDLNLIVMLLMALLRYPSDTARDAANRYAKNRGVSYGSFLGSYRQKYGLDVKASDVEVRKRMDGGIASGWKTDCSRVLGAVRWYHRAEVGANPGLADLYEPIIRKYLE